MTVPSDPNLTRQPSTLDPAVEIPEDAPRAQGHNEETAAEVAEAQQELHDTVQQESEQDEVTARKPGDHAGSDSDDGGTTYDGDCPPDGTVDEVLEWVGDDQARAKQALETEQAKSSPRTTLVSRLQEIAA